MRIELPFPSSILAGHANGNSRWAKIEATKKHREWARNAALEAGRLELPEQGDIGVVITFTPPHNLGDRLNFPARAKPYFDGLADALGVNDSRFLPVYRYAPACAPGFVVIEVTP